MASLDRILELLSKERISNEVSLRYHKAREESPVRNPLVNDYGEFCDRLGKYYCCLIAAEGGTVNERHALTAGWQIIESAHPGGVEGAYRDATSGENGGMIGIFNQLLEKLKRDAEQKYVLYVLRTEVNALSFDEQVDLCRQYLKKWGNHLPGEQQRAEELARDWEGLVTMLAESINTMRRETTRLP